MRKLTLVAAVVLLGLAQPSPAATSGGIVVRANGTISVEVELPHDATLTSWAIGGNAPVRGFVLRPLDGARFTRDSAAWGMDVSGWNDTLRYSNPGSNFTLTAGRYQLLLITTGPTQLRLDIPGRVVGAPHPFRAFRIARSSETYPRPVGVSPLPDTRHEADVPVRLSPRSTVLLSSRWKIDTSNVPGLAMHSYTTTFGEPGSACRRDTSTPGQPIAIEKTEYESTTDLLGSETHTSGPGCAQVWFDGPDYGSASDTVAITFES